MSYSAWQVSKRADELRPGDRFFYDGEPYTVEGISHMFGTVHVCVEEDSECIEFASGNTFVRLPL